MARLRVSARAPVCHSCGQPIAGEPVTFHLGGRSLRYHAKHAPPALPTSVTADLDILAEAIEAGRWADARQAMDSLGRKCGVTISGSLDPVMRVRAPWLSAADPEDRARFLSFAETLYALAGVVLPRAIAGGERYARPYEPLTVDRYIRTLQDEAKYVESLLRDESHGKKHGPFLVIPTKGVDDTSDALRALDEAAQKVGQKFPQVLYGSVYVRKDLRPKGTYDPSPAIGRSSGGVVAGTYQAAGDTMTLSMYATPERNTLMTLIHELGHRYHTRFLKGDKRDRFVELSTVGDVREHVYGLAERLGFADAWIARARGFRDDPDFGSDGPVTLSEDADLFFAASTARASGARDEWKATVSPLLRRFEAGDEGVVPELRKALARAHLGGNLRVVEHEDRLAPVLASSYGATSWEENFAESFLAYVMGKPLPEPLQRFMAGL